MGNSHYDAIVIGVGAMGSAAAFHLAARGKSVLALEQFGIGHDRGSSHGRSRIIRSVYTEGASYVPLARRAFALWRELETRTGGDLLVMTGGLDIGPHEGVLVGGSRAACAAHGIPHEILSGAEVNRRHPAFRLPAHFAAVAYTEAGILRPESCIRAHCRAASSLGAVIHENMPVESIAPGRTVTVRTADGACHAAPHLIVTAGAWIPALFPEFRMTLKPERQVVGWFPTARPDLFAPERFPVFIMEQDNDAHGTAIGWYGFPAFDGDPMKCARYGHRNEQVDADTMNRECTAQDRAVFSRLQPCFAVDLGEPSEMKTCIFTNSPDHHFVLGFHPRHDNIYIASPCSGHGFKFAPVIGEIIADEVVDDTTRHDIATHDIRRLMLP